MTALLELHLSCCVPLAIDDLQRRGGPLEGDYRDARAFANELAEKGDQILFHGKATAALATKLVRNMAVMAYAPGGVHFGSQTWCALHFPGGVASPICPTCSERAAIHKAA
jgi:hypothetical protein